jgi:hypothetical protein
VSTLEIEQAAFDEEANELDLREGPGLTEPPLNWVGPHDPEWTFTQWAEERGYSRERVEEVNDMYPLDPRELGYARQRGEREAAAAREYDRETRGWFGREWSEPELRDGGPLAKVEMERISDGVWGYNLAPAGSDRSAMHRGLASREPDTREDPGQQRPGELRFVADPRLSPPDRPAEHARPIDEGRWYPTDYDLGITDERQDEMGQPDVEAADFDAYGNLPRYAQYWPPEHEAGR